MDDDVSDDDDDDLQTWQATDGNRVPVEQGANEFIHKEQLRSDHFDPQNWSLLLSNSNQECWIGEPTIEANVSIITFNNNFLVLLLKNLFQHFRLPFSQALQHNKKELCEIKGMNKQAKESKYQAFKQLKHLQDDMAKDRKGRGDAVSMLKRNMGQRLMTLSYK